MLDWRYQQVHPHRRRSALRWHGHADSAHQDPQYIHLEQTRVYLEANVIPERLLVYVDEQVAPNGAQSREAYGVYWSANHDWYLKAGEMYLPFGLRLQDQSAFIQTTSGINMTTSDNGVEFGWERGHWTRNLPSATGREAPRAPITASNIAGS